jgi:hypothetical protein
MDAPHGRLSIGHAHGLACKSNQRGGHTVGQTATAVLFCISEPQPMTVAGEREKFCAPPHNKLSLILLYLRRERQTAASA